MRLANRFFLVCVALAWLGCAIGGCGKDESNQEPFAGNANSGSGGTQQASGGSPAAPTTSGGSGGETDQTPSGGSENQTNTPPVVDSGSDGASAAVDAAVADTADSQTQTQTDAAPLADVTADVTIAPTDAQVTVGTNCLKGSGDYTDNGPYEVAMRDVEVPDFGLYTLFYPANLEADCPHPIVSWGNGTGVAGSGVYAHFNDHAASWGMVVIASHSSESISIPYVDAGVDWLLEQNNDPNSEFYQKLSTRAGAAGHSQGGRAATEATHHANVAAAVSVQGGQTPDPKAAFICLTGVADIARERCTLSYDEAQGPAFLADHQEADHITTPTILGVATPAGIQYKRLLTAWFRCFLADDPAACSMFKDGCSLCSEPGWARIEGKNM
jgi:hypothetical protein